MGQFAKPIKTKEILFVLTVSCLFISCWILYPSFRYEKTSMGKIEIRRDRFTGAIYFKNSLNPKAECIPTGHANIMETKYHLAEKELEEMFEEIRKEMQQKPRDGVSLSQIRVLAAPPQD